MNNLLLAFYADDFTGATDAMEALTVGGAATTLMLDASCLERVPLPQEVRCVGVAGTTRSLSPAEIEAELSAAIPRLCALKPPLLQYKVCSTFDSSPALGSIGQAIDTALAHFGRVPVPLVVGVPRLGRYCVFGNLFARAGSAQDVHRLDRHPIMSRHPLTPMKEADLRRVLAEQTAVPVILQAVTDGKEPGFTGPSAAGRVVLCDVLDETCLERIGKAVWEGVAAGSVRFAVGSSGLDYALIAEWRRLGLIAPEPYASPCLSPVSQVLVVSASCSAVTVEQLRCAAEAGFAEIGVDRRRLSAQPESELGRLVDAARRALAEGRSVAVHTFPGASSDAEPASGFMPSAELATHLAALINDLLPGLASPRVIVCGGDTSSHVGRALEIERLDFAASVDPGAPLCSATRRMPPQSFEVAFKGGQMGRPDYLIRTLGGSLSNSFHSDCQHSKD